MTEPTGMDFGDFAEPAWVPCKRCGVESARELCWSCERLKAMGDAASERASEAEMSVFEGYRVPFEAAALAKRGVSQAMFELARRALAKPNVVIHGSGTGQGKSSLGGAMLIEWARKTGRTARWVSAYKLSGGSFELPDELVEADLVLIDDVGNERQLSSNLLPELCEIRRGNARALWVTTALDGLAMQTKYGANIARRIFGGASILRFDAVKP